MRTMGKKKIAAAALALVLILSVAGCGSLIPGRDGGGSDTSDASDANTGEAAEEILEEAPLSAKEEDDGILRVGILLYRSHGAASEAAEGFKKELTSMLSGREILFDEESADGDAQKCAQIATDFANTGHRLIFACGTEAVQNSGAAVKDVPIIGGCVSDYLMSEVVGSLDAPGGNITGVSSLGPINEQMDQILRVIPGPVTVGIVSSGTEVGSRFQESIAGQCLNETGTPWMAYHSSTEEGLRKVMQLAAQECTCIFLPTDNFVAEHMDIVREVSLENGIPVLTGDYQMCSRGGLCCVSIDYYEHGKKAADMAYAVLEKGEEISRMAIQEEEEWQEYYNPVIAERIGWYNYGSMIPLQVTEESMESSAEETEEEKGDSAGEETEEENGESDGGETEEDSE
ncbi:MAG: ABC transporter substrate-binding protein [Eubacteriales bacterium]|nr:ABC transporter substrate-binding protein [Eubacteriales bacterium]